MKLAVIASHPIQYHAPLYRILAGEIEVKVFFAHLPDAVRQGDGFGVAFEWDVPLTGGYDSEVFAQDLARFRDGAGIWRAASRLEESLRQWQPDAILHTGWHHPGMVAGLLAALRSGRPLLFRGETNLLARRAWWKLAIHKVLLAKFSQLLYIGELNRRYYEHLGFSGHRFCPYFSDCGRLATEAARLAADRAAIRARWGIGSDETCFLFCGKLEPKKRPLDFARAVACVAGSRGLVVGDGELRAVLESSSAPLHLAGFLNQGAIAAAYTAADVLVLPSDAGETWGLVVNEAMACGLPCIVSDLVGCRPDLVIEGVTGFSYPCGDVAALASRMRVLAGDPALREKMGAAARERVSSIYTVERAAEAVLAAAREAVACRETPGRATPR